MKQLVKYDPVTIEQKWQKVWEKEGIYKPDLDLPAGKAGSAKKLFFNLMMFPYPSAEGMHVGNMYAFTGSDIYGRFKRMQGYSVFEPIGLDGFGIHSENYAIKVGRHPKKQAEISEKNFYRQLRSTGNAYDWSRTVETYDPLYYKWTQWIFIQLFKAGLAYRKKSAVNFCPADKTVLADEQVIDGRCERDGALVEKRDLEQWFFKITAYADRLLSGLDKIDWTEKVKISQRNWIGRSEGALIEFKVQSSKFKIEVFTTALDTIFGVTFMVLSPQHLLLKDLEIPKDYIQIVKKYIKEHQKNDVIKAGKEKTGVFTGLHVVNPFNGESIPLWIADYVLMEYGTGAVMGVPGHDARDHEFAKKYKLPVKSVIKPTKDAIGSLVGQDGFWDYPEIKEKFADKSMLFDSVEFTGLTSRKAKEKMMSFIEEKQIGKRKINYHIRDWLISRQRYWGPPIPMVFCQTCADNGLSWFSSSVEQEENVSSIKYQVSSKSKKIGNTKYTIHNTDMAGWFPVRDDQLPVLLPEVKDWKPKGTGKSPLASIESFVNTTCPRCGGKAVRETDVSDTFFDSSWYFFRYISTEFKDRAWDKDRVKKWLPVDMYIGGAEHSVLHLLYTRFLTMVFHDLGMISFDEPFPRFYAHGLLIKEGAKMSKSKGNVVVPDDYIRKYGADTLRTYLMFLGPFSQGGDFYDSSIGGVHRFLQRVYKLFDGQNQHLEKQSANENVAHKERKNEKIEAKIHEMIKKISQGMEGLRFNTAVAGLMELLNALEDNPGQVKKIHKEQFLLMLAPFAPHLAEELFQNVIARSPSTSFRINSATWQSQKDTHGPWPQDDKKWKSIHTQPWPIYDQKLLEKDEVTIVVSVNGKLRDTIKNQKSKIKNQKHVEELARKSNRVKKHLERKRVKKVIYIEGKIINFVTD